MSPLHLHIFAVLCMSIVMEGSTLATHKDENKFQVYFDEGWRPVPLLTVTNLSTIHRTPLRRYGLLPCECFDLQCGCCVNTNYFSTHRSGCLNMTYDPDEFSIGMNMLWNGESVYQNSVSAKNPPPACMEAPIPYLPSIQFCIRLFDIYTPGRNIHMCVNFETRVARAPILVLEFDCIQMGVDGIDHVKFNTTESPSNGGSGSGVKGPTTQATHVTINNNDTSVDDIRNMYMNEEPMSPIMGNQTIDNL